MARTRSDIAPRIVEAARTRFLAEGVDATALRAIANDAGTSIGMIYYYFPTKDDLFFAVIEETYSQLLDDLTRACDPALPPIERMRGVFRRVGAIDDDELAIVRLVVREVLGSSSRLQRLLDRFRRGHFPLVSKALADGVADGTVRDDVSPAVLLPVAISVGAIPQLLVRHFVGHRGRGHSRIEGDALADQLVEVLWHGIELPRRRVTKRRSTRRRRR